MRGNIMAGRQGNLILEHLRHIRSRVDQIADDMSDLKQPHLRAGKCHEFDQA